MEFALLTEVAILEMAVETAERAADMRAAADNVIDPTERDAVEKLRQELDSCRGLYETAVVIAKYCRMLGVNVPPIPGEDSGIPPLPPHPEWN